MTVPSIAQRRINEDIRVSIALLPQIPEAVGMVVACFANVKASKAQRAEAYAQLDAEINRGPIKPWHSVLRSCRNHPIHGRELFALWS